MYVYKRTERQLWTVGYYAPDGTFEPESDHSSSEDAAARAAWLNGSGRDGAWLRPDNHFYVPDGIEKSAKEEPA